MRRFVLEARDGKAQALARAAAEAGLEPRTYATRVLSNARFLFGPDALRRGDVFLIRYLSGQPSRIRTLLALVDDVVRAVAFRVAGVHTFWLCHNVDRETPGPLDWVARLRRALWTRFATRILVPDPSLMPCAMAVFPKQRHKLEPICFGPLPSEGAMAPEVKARLVEHLAGGTGPGRRLRILVAGEGGEKYLHFDLLPRLHGELLRRGWSPRIAVVSPLTDRVLTKGRDYSELVAWCREREDVLLIDEWVRLRERELADHVDVVWRAMADHSIPFTLFNAAQARLPVLTYDAGHLGRTLDGWGIGATVDRDFGNVDEAVAAALATDEAAFDAFLRDRTWDATARHLARVVRSL